MVYGGSIATGCEPRGANAVGSSPAARPVARPRRATRSREPGPQSPLGTQFLELLEAAIDRSAEPQAQAAGAAERPEAWRTAGAPATRPAAGPAGSSGRSRRVS